MKMKKRFLSILLSLAMVLGLLPGMSLTAYAAPAGTAVTQSTGLPNNAGTYYLNEDITITSTWTVPGNTTLDLNGHGIKMTGSGPVIAIEQGAHLTLNDSAPNAQHKYKVPEASHNGAGRAVVDDTGDKTFTGGYITGGNNKLGQSGYQERGGGIRVRKGKLTMNAGTIIGNHTNDGGGAIGTDDNATVDIYGGSLLHNSAGNIGGAIQQKANIYNCTIEGNIAPNAGAINSGVVTINATGAGHKVRIANNYATNENGQGGGVRAIQSLSGNVEFEDNYAGTTRSDAYLFSAITVNNLNANSKPIYVILHNTKGAITTNANYNNDEAAKAVFMSGRPGYAVIANTSKQAEIVPGINVTLSGGTNATASGGATNQTELTGEMTAVTYTANSGCKFPETSDYYKTTNGITVARTSDTVVRVSGKPTADATITVPDALAPISQTVTFKVANGKWDDNTTADKTVTLNGYEGDTLKLAATDIPAVGTKPNDTYKAGSWDVTPSADTEITGATTYTYTYAQKDSISQTVTFKVVNGSWNDETTTDKTVTLTGYEGDTLKLAATDIPAVGTKPNDTYKAGSWDTTPSAGTAIMAATTYTYTYAAKEASVVTNAPTAKTLTYTGSAQALVTAGKAAGGTMQYAIGTKDKATQPYTTSIPTATNAGTYYVWYKAKGDSNHIDSATASVIVTIAEKQTEAPADPATPEKTEAPAVPDNPKDEAAPAKIQANASIQLNAGFLVYWKGSTVCVKWGKAPEADQFEIYAQYCGSKTCKKILTVKSGNSASFKRLNGKKLNRKLVVKAYVVASKNGKEIGRTILGHAAGSRNSHTNAKKVKVSKKSYTLAVGKSAKIKAKIVKAKSRKKLPGKGHCAKLRYTSSNTKVATVSKSGKIKAVGKGKCDIRIFAQNGRSCKVTVTVK